MTNPLVSVIVISHNSSEYISRALKSATGALEQIRSEIILVDDASQDNTVEVAQETFESLAEDNPHISYRLEHLETNLGPSGARNRGVEKSAGEYVMFLDSDDELLPGAVPQLMRATRGGSVDVVSGTHVAAVAGGKQFARPDAARGVMSGYAALVALLEERAWNYNHGKLYRRSLLQRVRHDETVRRYEDLIFNAAVFSRASQVNFVETKVYLYRIHGLSATWSQEITPAFVHNTASKVCAGVSSEMVSQIPVNSWEVMRFTLAIVNFSTALLSSGTNQNLPVLRKLVRECILRRSFFYVLRRVPVLGLSGLFAVISPRLYKKFYSAYVKRSYGL